MHKKFAHLPFLVLTAIYFGSCKPEAPLIPFEGEKIVVYALLMPDTAITVRLSKSQTSLDTAKDRSIEIAEVVLFKGTIPLDTLKHIGGGLYVTAPNKKLAEGGTYHVQAKAPGFPDAVSLPERIPRRPKILSVTTNKGVGSVSNATVAFNVEPDTEKMPGFALHFMQNNGQGQRQWYSLGFLDGCPEGGGTSTRYFACFNIRCSTNRNTFRFQASRLPVGHTASGWIAYTTGAFIDFHSDYQRQYDASLDPIFYEPLNVRSNIQGGYGAVVAFSPQWVSFSF
jgi:Domain of unknown function (DUF4249)